MRVNLRASQDGHCETESATCHLNLMSSNEVITGARPFNSSSPLILLEGRFIRAALQPASTAAMASVKVTYITKGNQQVVITFGIVSYEKHRGQFLINLLGDLLETGWVRFLANGRVKELSDQLRSEGNGQLRNLIREW